MAEQPKQPTPTSATKGRSQGAGPAGAQRMTGHVLPVDSSIGSPYGVGGDDMLTFQIGVAEFDAKGRPKLKKDETIEMELAPARRSFYDKSGQQPPGAGGGLHIRARANLAKLNVPGSRPIYQMMGIAEETLEWVGAFIGRDVEQGDPMSPFGYPEFPPLRGDTEPGVTGWAQSNALTNVFRRGREVCVVLRWGRREGKPEWAHGVGFQGSPADTENFVWYTGYIKDFERCYATEHRVYYRIQMAVTNRQDVNHKVSEASPITLPPVFRVGVPSDSQVKESQLNQEKAENGGITNEERAKFSITTDDANWKEIMNTKPEGVSEDDVKLFARVVNTTQETEDWYQAKLADPIATAKSLDDIEKALSTGNQLAPNAEGAKAGVRKITAAKAELLRRRNERVKKALKQSDAANQKREQMMSGSLTLAKNSGGF